MSSQNPLSYTSCDEYEKKISLPFSHPNHIGPVNTHPNAKNTNTLQKLWKTCNKSTNCCSKVLQCNNPNEWLKKNNFNDRCTINQPTGPHFSKRYTESFQTTRQTTKFSPTGIF